MDPDQDLGITGASQNGEGVWTYPRNNFSIKSKYDNPAFSLIEKPGTTGSCSQDKGQIVKQGVVTRLCDFMPKNTQGENGIELKKNYVANDSTTLLPNYDDYKFGFNSSMAPALYFLIESTSGYLGIRPAAGWEYTDSNRYKFRTHVTLNTISGGPTGRVRVFGSHQHYTGSAPTGHSGIYIIYKQPYGGGSGTYIYNSGKITGYGLYTFDYTFDYNQNDYLYFEVGTASDAVYSGYSICYIYFEGIN